MAGFYNTHLRRTADPTQITKTKIFGVCTST